MGSAGYGTDTLGLIVGVYDEPETAVGYLRVNQNQQALSKSKATQPV